MAKAVRKRQKVGYALSVNRTGVKGAQNWERVGFLFNSKYEAEDFRKAHYSHIAKAHVAGVRIHVEPLLYTPNNKAEAKDRT